MDAVACSAMQRSFPLVALFLQVAAEHAQHEALTPDDRDWLERLLHQSWEDGHATWPDVPLSEEVFVRHLARIFVREVDSSLPHPSEADAVHPVLRFIEPLHHSDLYLACACAEGNPGALLAFERHYLALLPGMLAHLREPLASVEDVCQQLRARFLVRTPNAPPKITSYSGRGPLRTWLRVSAVRDVLCIRRGPQGGFEGGCGASAGDVFKLPPSLHGDPELEHIKRLYRCEFHQAVVDAFAGLSDKDRDLFRLSVIEGLSTPAISRLYQVNQSTISRWLTSAKQRVFDETKALLQRRLRLSPGEFESILRVLNSQIDVSLSRILKKEDDTDGLDAALATGSRS